MTLVVNCASTSANHISRSAGQKGGSLLFTVATVPTPVVSSSVMFRCVGITNVVFESFIQMNSEFTKFRSNRNSTLRKLDRLDYHVVVQSSKVQGPY